jgi:hypothetical protein
MSSQFLFWCILFTHFALQVGTKVNPSTMVPSVKILALELQFEVRSEVKMVPSFLRCFPNVETLHVFVNLAGPSYLIWYI